MPNLAARPRGDHDIQPIAARPTLGRRDDLHHVAVLQGRLERYQLAVDPRARALVTDIGVDVVGKI